VQVLVDSWNDLLEECQKKRIDETKKEREKAIKERKEPKVLPEGTLPEKVFNDCLLQVLQGKHEPTLVQDGIVGAEADQSGAERVLSKDSITKLAAEAAKIGKVAFGATGEKPADKLVNYNDFCKNYSQGDFNAERYCQRKWENIYGQLQKNKSHMDNLASRSSVKQALESPEMGLSGRMVERLLKKYEDVVEEEDGEEDEPEIKYPDLCWRFARKNIQDIMHEKCLTIFRKARVLDKARSKQVPKAEMEKVLRSPEVGLSEYEADLFLRKYIEHRELDVGLAEDVDAQIDYDFILSGKWEEIPCNQKLYDAFVGLEKNWEKIADRFMSSDVTTENGEIHMDDFKELVLELNLDELKDKGAVEQVGQDLGPDPRGFLKLNDFSWKMLKPLLIEVVAPVAPQLLFAFKAKLHQLKTDYLKYKAEMAGKSLSNLNPGQGKQAKIYTAIELKAMERASSEEVLTSKYTEDVVRIFLQVFIR